MFAKLTPGQEVQTVVAAVSGGCIFLDLNAKSEGVLDCAELSDENGVCSVKPGDSIRAYFLGERGGELRFTTKISGQTADAAVLENAFQNRIPVEGRVEQERKGGFEVSVGSARAFCPYSQMGFRQRGEPADYIGRTLPFLIQEYKDDGRNIVVSNRAVLEKEHAARLESLSRTITEGAVVEGTVLSLQDFGAFVGVDGFQALLPASEIGLERISDIHSVLSVGQNVTVKVLKADWQRERVSVSMKALIADPWETAAATYKPGMKLDGTIARIAEYGLFISLEPGIDGLLHSSALEGVDRTTNLRKRFKTGGKLSVQIKEVNAEARRISLIPASSAEQDETAARYLRDQNDDSETYNPFAALLK
ncbi:MAG: S1 RNA-binding domain-containing protein [Treponemataceae bacterium]|nr:S1 RNA-binding domain-containing protein [Treponemataceae bacterium]